MTDETNLVIVKTRIEKAAVSGSMGLAEQVQFFADVDELLRSYAKRRHKDLTHEKAFVKELHDNEAFRSVVQKASSLQQELAAA